MAIDTVSTNEPCSQTVYWSGEIKNHQVCDLPGCAGDDAHCKFCMAPLVAAAPASEPADYSQGGDPYGIAKDYTGDFAGFASTPRKPREGEGGDERGNTTTAPRGIPTQEEADRVRYGWKVIDQRPPSTRVERLEGDCFVAIQFEDLRDGDKFRLFNEVPCPVQDDGSSIYTAATDARVQPDGNIWVGIEELGYRPGDGA